MKKLSKPEAGHSKKAGKCLRVLKEFKLDKAAELNVGDQLTATVFAPGDRVDITGISKGLGSMPKTASESSTSPICLPAIS